MTDELTSFMTDFCKAGAEAVETYVRVSGESPERMPEYFLISTIFRALGNSRAITLETPWRQIYKWTQRRRPGPEVSDGDSWKVDMVIYDGEGKHPDDQAAWAFVEVKNGYIDADFNRDKRTDRDKLIRLHNGIANEHPPLHLICCGAIHTLERRLYHREKAEENRDLWFEAKVSNLPSDYGPHFFCARVIQDLRLPE